jgi:hypothetical protein
MRKSIIILLFIFFGTICQARDKGSVPEGAVPEVKKWDFAMEYFHYVGIDESIPEGTFYGDHGDLHLEARFNYEDIDTASLFAGKRFTFGKEVEFSLVPMAGVLFGNTEGLAPGFIINISWGMLNFYSESEYIFDFSGRENDFFYEWMELVLKPIDWLYFGLAFQKFQLFETPYEYQRGITLGFDIGSISVGGYLFNIDREDSYGIIAFDIDF